MQLNSTIISLLEYWKNCLSRNNNSYKFVLALAILDHIKSEQTPEVSYEKLIRMFLRFYWDQSVIYKLNHSANPNQVPVFIKLINELNPPDIYFKKARSIYAEEISEIETYLLKSYMRVVRNPVSRFQKEYTVQNMAEGDKSGTGRLYNWSEDRGTLLFDKETFQAIKKHLELFKDITVLQFVQFLEKHNSIPKLYRKLGLDNKRLPISTKLKTIILESASFCFYCESELTSQTEHIDHFIPWSYVLEHDEFNLVLACQPCNNGANGKMALLPGKEYIERLQDRNLDLFGANETTYRKNSMIENQWRSANNAGYLIWKNHLHP